MESAYFETFRIQFTVCFDVNSGPVERQTSTNSFEMSASINCINLAYYYKGWLSIMSIHLFYVV